MSTGRVREPVQEICGLRLQRVVGLRLLVAEREPLQRGHGRAGRRQDVDQRVLLGDRRRARDAEPEQIQQTPPRGPQAGVGAPLRERHERLRRGPARQDPQRRVARQYFERGGARLAHQRFRVMRVALGQGSARRDLCGNQPVRRVLDSARTRRNFDFHTANDGPRKQALPEDARFAALVRGDWPPPRGKAPRVSRGIGEDVVRRLARGLGVDGRLDALVAARARVKVRHARRRRAGAAAVDAVHASITSILTDVVVAARRAADLRDALPDHGREVADGAHPRLPAGNGAPAVGVLVIPIVRGAVLVVGTGVVAARERAASHGDVFPGRRFHVVHVRRVRHRLLVGEVPGLFFEAVVPADRLRVVQASEVIVVFEPAVNAGACSVLVRGDRGCPPQRDGGNEARHG
mmetsp:Transcript_14035/g.43600  ORF Transcript_14035/g.43600 Transcript_14035/m.43600 type:complete len:406 (+) Transcript_14035:779-1996(+)